MSNLEILAYEQTPLGLLCLRRRELLSRPGTVITEVSLDNEFLMSSYNTASERALATVALEMHRGEGLRVLVGGLGLGYTAYEVLKSSRVTLVEVVEFLPEVMEWLADGLVPLASELNADARCQVVRGDVYARLAAAPAKSPADSPAARLAGLFDLILIDVDHSPDHAIGEESSGFYSEAGLRRAQQHLAPGGILGVWSYAESSPFADALRATFSKVRIERVEFENTLVDEQVTDWIFFARD